ncbi:MAG: POTRA domain-containing protein, partial [bacterium]
MSSVWLRAVASATIILTCSFPPATANPAQVDDSRLAWAYGSIVDSVTVSGNKNTRSHAVLREMQTQPGDVLVESTIKRDIRFIGDMSPFASVEASAESLGPGHCALRIRVEERNGLF